MCVNFSYSNLYSHILNTDFLTCLLNIVIIVIIIINIIIIIIWFNQI